MSQFLISYKPIKIMPFQFMYPGKVGYFKAVEAYKHQQSDMAILILLIVC